MTESQYQNLTPREATPGADSRLFSFSRIRSGATTRFYPGDGARLRFASLAADTLELPGVPAGLLAAGDAVTAHYRGVCVFRGDVETVVEERGRGTDATQAVTCAGPWAKLERLVYRQEWFVGDGYARSSRLVLNQTRLGAAQTLDEALLEIAAHGAAACGYSVAPDGVSVSAQVLPADECRDITVADALRRELRLFPKAVAAFDYSASPPALRIWKSAAAATAAYVSSVPTCRRERVYNVHPVTGVDLEIETTGEVDGAEYRRTEHQTAGDASAGNPDCLYATLQVRGARASATRQSFKSVTEDIPADLNDASWWKARHPRLANVPADAVTISDGARSPANCPRISASTAGELEAAGLRCEVSKFTCRATIATEDDREEDVYLTCQFLTTNAAGTRKKPKTYAWTTATSAESGESVPAGLAAAILAERSGRLLSESMTVRLGDALPRLGDAVVEADGTVFLQSVDVDCGGLTADLSFGAPAHLPPEDMASLLSGFRNKRTSSSSSLRTTGRPKGGDTVEMGAIPPLSSSEFAPGVKSKTTIRASAGAGAIRLDASELEGGEEISVREVTVKGEDGEEQTVKVLATADFNPGGGASGVTSANGADGAVCVVGGEGISVSTSGRTITISYQEGKEPDEDPNADPCAHDEAGGAGGGVLAGGGGGGGYGGGGGVPAGGDGHPGDDDCNCD